MTFQGLFHARIENFHKIVLDANNFINDLKIKI